MTDIHHDVAEIVLVVEDETLVRLFANDILTEAGYRVLEARDGQEALAILEVHENIRVLFTDIRMPNIDGLMLTKLVRERWPEIGLVITSGDTAAPQGEIFVSKPYTCDTIVNAINKALAGARSQGDQG